MTVDDPAPNSATGSGDTARAARRLVRTALKGALATLDHRSPGQPYASLVLIATEPDGAPIMLISRLALHTRNLAQDARASLLMEGAGTPGDPMASARLTLTGNVRPSESATALRRFLARHPSAQAYAALPDFAAFRFEIATGHYIGGFARIVDLAAAALMTDIARADELVVAEPDIIAHMNADHSDAIALFATQIAGCQPGDWRLSGIDPDGADLLHRSNSARMDFASAVHNAEEARRALVALARQARNSVAH